MTSTERATVRRISPDEAAALIRSATPPTLFDVRDLPSYQQGHVEGAAHLVESRLMAWFSRLAKEKPVLIYCYKGNASQTFGQMFCDFRFATVYSVDGGYEPLTAALAAAEMAG